MAKSIQSTVKSSRLHRVPKEGMVSNGPGGERVSRHCPPVSPCAPDLARTSPIRQGEGTWTWDVTAE